jgi:hypothetical protein
MSEPVPERRRRAPSGKPWLPVYWLLFGAGIAATIAFVLSAGHLQSVGLTRSIYYIVLIPLGLACATFLFGALRSSEASYEGKLFGANLKLSGSVVVFVLVVAGGLKLAPPDSRPAAASLVVRVQGPGGPADRITQGVVWIDAGTARWPGNVGPNGEAHFEEIPADAVAQPMLVTFTGLAGYEVKDQTPRRFPERGVLYLELRRVRTEAFGVVRDRHGQPVPDVRIVLEYGAAEGTTKKDGTFRIPCDMPNDGLVHVVAERVGHIGYSGNLSLPGPMEIQFDL